MKSILKSAFGVLAAASIVGTSIAPATFAWGDNGNGRPSYTISQINSGVLGDKIVLNSISNGTFGDEKNFVGARLDTGVNAGASNVWNENEISIEDGKTYIVRLYVHNNNPNGVNAVAKDVTTAISIPTTSGTSLKVNGTINSSNATPTKYWDDVVFKSNSNFHLEYVEGSALLENNGIGANGGYKLSDNLVGSGVMIGYDSLNGQIPGCYQYSTYVSVRVKAVIDDAIVEKQVSKTGEKGTWVESIDANIGDTVYYRIHYKNTSGSAIESVAVKDVLPTNMEYVKGTTKLYNATNPNGIDRDDTITTTGVYIGGYANGGDAYVIFAAKIIDKELGCGYNKLINWGQVTAGNKVTQDNANVMVAKACANTSETAKTLPNTGATSVVVSALGLGTVVTAAGYYIASRKALR